MIDILRKFFLLSPYFGFANHTSDQCSGLPRLVSTSRSAALFVSLRPLSPLRLKGVSTYDAWTITYCMCCIFQAQDGAEFRPSAVILLCIEGLLTVSTFDHASICGCLGRIGTQGGAKLCVAPAIYKLRTALQALMFASTFVVVPAFVQAVLGAILLSTTARKEAVSASRTFLFGILSASGT